MRRVPVQVVLVTLLLVSMVLAGVVSFHASGSPDGLERVAEDEGFLDTASEHAAANGPMADYQTKGVQDERLSGGVAGVTGSLVVLVVAGGLAYAVRRRSSDSTSEAADRAPQPADRP